LFIADTYNNRVRRVDAVTGIITTVAGNGTMGFSGDGDLATSARVGRPTGVAVDTAGNLFIVERGRHVIRRVDAATGIITTVASKEWLDLVAGFGGDGGPATNARLKSPRRVAVGRAGNLFIVDSGNQRVRRVDAATGIITTVAGNGTDDFEGDGGPATSTGFWTPSGVTVDRAGNLFIADTYHYRIRRVDAATGIITTVGGNGTEVLTGLGGPATHTGIGAPYGVAVDKAGNLFVCNTVGFVFKVDSAGALSLVANIKKH
jgi:sugar lactone lactonase YvrE